MVDIQRSDIASADRIVRQAELGKNIFELVLLRFGVGGKIICFLRR